MAIRESQVNFPLRVEALRRLAVVTKEHRNVLKILDAQKAKA